MKNLIYIAILFSLNLFGQNITQLGYNYVINSKGDTISKHSTFRKSLDTSINQPKKSVKDTFYIDQPKIRVIIDAKEINTSFAFEEIVIHDVTKTSAVFEIYLNEEISYASITYGEVGTRESNSIDMIDNKIVSLNPLRSNTEYQFQMIAKNLKSESIVSRIYKFKTL